MVWEDGGGDPASYPIMALMETENLAGIASFRICEASMKFVQCRVIIKVFDMCRHSF